MFIRAVVGPSAYLLAAAAPVAKVSEKPKAEEEAKIKCRPSDLPIYPPPTTTVTNVKRKEPSELENKLLGPVTSVRKVVCETIAECEEIGAKVSSTVTDTAKNFNFIVTYLREEENEPERYGAVAMGTLTGYIFGLRGGIIKRIFYSLIGTGAMGSICFPEQAKLYYAEGINQGKLATQIAYNFIYGVKPGDPQHEIHFPDLKIPQSFGEVVEIGVNLGKSVANAIMPSSSPEDSSNPPKK